MKPATNGIRIMPYSEWTYHPNWLTEKQLLKKGLIPAGEPVAQVFWISKWVEGHYILLWDIEKATPKVISESKKAQVAKAKETLYSNRTCPICHEVRDYKIDYEIKSVKMCGECRSLQREVDQAREWLSDPSVILLDTETNGLHGEPVQIGIARGNGETLLDTYVKPHDPINEALEEWGEDYRGQPVLKRTAFAIHGISNEMVKDAPTFPELWPRLVEILVGSRLLIFNADYDMSCLRHAMHTHGIKAEITDRSECVMRWYSQYHGEWVPKYRDYKFISLQNALNEQSVKIDAPAHSALGDCQRTLALITTIAAKTAPLDTQETL